MITFRRLAIILGVLMTSLTANAQFNPNDFLNMSPQDIINMSINSMKFETTFYHDDYNRLVCVMSNTVTSEILVGLILGNREYWVNLQRMGSKEGHPYYPIPGTSVGVSLLRNDGRGFVRIHYYSKMNEMHTYKQFIDCPKGANVPVSDTPNYCKANYKYAYPDEYAPFELEFETLSKVQAVQMQGGKGGGNTAPGSSSTTGTPSSGKHVCGLCNGTGYMVKNDATDFGGTKWCETCKKSVSQSHYHAPCVSCGGKGKW